MELFQRLFFGLMTLCLCINGNKSEFKQWQPNTNWNNPDNWNTGKIPCSGQEVQLISLQPLVVAVSGQASLHSLTLPSNGELIMNEGAEMTFSDQEGQCSGDKDIRFTATEHKEWYNPSNWREIDNDGSPLVHQYSGLLHLNQIPCVHDQVSFKQESSYMVKSEFEVTVATIVMNDKTHLQESFDNYLGTSTGKIEFSFKKGIKLTGETCSDSKGCYCGTDHMKSKVCSFVTCKLEQCKRPISPKGSCCKYCGAIVMAKPLPEFNFDNLNRKLYNLSEAFLQVRSNNVQLWYSMSRTEDGLVQLVFADSEDGEKAQMFSEKVTRLLKSENSFLKFKDEMKSSDQIVNSSSELAIAVGLGVGVPVLVAIIIVLVVLVKKRSLSSLSRVRGNESSQNGSNYVKVELQNKSASTEQLSPGAEPEASCHDNKVLENDNVLYGTADVKTTFGNPLYDNSTDIQDRII